MTKDELISALKMAQRQDWVDDLSDAVAALVKYIGDEEISCVAEKVYGPFRRTELAFVDNEGRMFRHVKCGGILLFQSGFKVRILLCDGCDFRYNCEPMERPIEAVYRLCASQQAVAIVPLVTDSAEGRSDGIRPHGL